MSIKFRNEVTMRPIETVMPYYRNAKLHDEEQIKKIAAQIATVGWDQPIVVDTQGIIIKGHGRLAAATSLGLTEVPVIVSDISEKEARLARIADNKVAESGWDNDMLAQELADLKALGESLDLSAFESKEVDEVLNEYDRKTNPRNETEDEVPEVKETTVKLGDLYQLGNHRLLCGDATKKEDVERLMGGERADMVFTDPPYNQSKSGGGMEKLRPNWSKHKDGLLNDFEVSTFENLIAWIKPQSFYAFCNKGLLGAYIKFAESFGGWDLLGMRKKNPIPMKKNKYLSDMEWIVFGRIKSAYFNDQLEYDFYRKIRDISVQESEYGHPTQKQISFIEPSLLISSPVNAIIVDPFLGTGTTLIACEKTNRKCFGSEIDPLYCAVIIERWEKFTGQKATLIENLQTLEMTSDGSEMLLESPLDPALLT